MNNKLQLESNGSTLSPKSSLQSTVKELDITFHKALKILLSESSPALVAIMNDIIEQISGHKASDQQLIDFLKKIGFRYKKYKILGISTKQSMPPEGTECKMALKRKKIIYFGVIFDGMLIVDGYTPFSSFSTAATTISKVNKNGWAHWEIKLPNSTEWQLADKWRKSNS